MDRFWIILGLVAVAFIGLFIFTKPDSDGKTELTRTQAVKVLKRDHVRGPRDAKVVLIEYGDFQCPGCGRYYPILKQLEATYDDRVAFVFRHLPLRQLHANAQSAAQSAEAASAQDKFFEMHDRLYESQNEWGDLSTNQQKTFESYAQELGLEVKQFRKDYLKTKTARRINSDLASAQLFDTSETPTFVLNGRVLKGKDIPGNQAAFAKLLDEQLNKK